MVKAFSTKWEDLEEPIKIFLPIDLCPRKVVLNARVADALGCIQSLIHGVEVKATLERVSSALSSTLMAEHCRPLVKFPTMTQFKRLQQKCHELIAAAQFDEDTAEKAGQVAQLTSDMAAYLKQIEHVAHCQTVNALFEFVGRLRDFKIAYISLPSTPSSAHAPVRHTAIVCFDDALTIMGQKSSRILRFQCLGMCIATYYYAHIQMIGRGS